MNSSLQEIQAKQHQEEATRQIQKVRITWDDQPVFFSTSQCYLLKKQGGVRYIKPEIT